MRELTADQVGNALAARAEAFTDLAALIPSRMDPGIFRNGDDVALAKPYVASDAQGLLGALMPMQAVPELSAPAWPASILPPPLSWPRRDTFTALANNSLLREFDGRGCGTVI